MTLSAGDTGATAYPGVAGQNGADSQSECFGESASDLMRLGHASAKQAIRSAHAALSAWGEVNGEMTDGTGGREPDYGVEALPQTITPGTVRRVGADELSIGADAGESSGDETRECDVACAAGGRAVDVLTFPAPQTHSPP